MSTERPEHRAGWRVRGRARWRLRLAVKEQCSHGAASGPPHTLGPESPRRLLFCAFHLLMFAMLEVKMEGYLKCL